MLRAARELLTTCAVLVACATLGASGCDAKSAKDDPASKTASKTPGKAGDPVAADPGKTPAPPTADMILEAPGVDLSKLSPPQRESFFQVINTESSACGQAHSLAMSVRDDGECRDSIHVAQFIADRLASGAAAGDIKLDIDTVVKALAPREVPIEGRPVWGNERAPVTVVVFADFQCPMCKHEAPQLRAAVEGQRGRAKLVFKHFPLTEHHPRAEAAGAAAEAAHLQGKFWEMHDLLFANQDALEDPDLLAYAKQIPGLDVAKWQADVASEPVKLKVAEDRAHGEKLDLPGTPTVYVDGRELVPMLWGGEVDAWIEDALRR
ncbi:DsbA family protein [Enhygromyxa salina]|uniref:Disulfide bond formation protein D n=1 Tax=Enhygromyxa salina TaxID=215803 RepID=A0A2S9YUG7_9BACT|nr:thioredoxin domain-containing protein [Enhygromyxa salina]PRQ08738.1 Disulfide bond formation protein D precursor [Enhygromyxa salina]